MTLDMAANAEETDIREQTRGMTLDLAEFAKQNDVKYFMISYTDLFGGQRAKLVPAQAIADMLEDGAGFATYLDLTPAHPDMLAMPDPFSVIQLR
jgi:glutamine synthetase